MNDDKTIDLASIRARLAGTEGRQYWQSLEELADSPSFAALVQREFPAQASEWLDPKGRRGFLKLMGALRSPCACSRLGAGPCCLYSGYPVFFVTPLSATWFCTSTPL